MQSWFYSNGQWAESEDYTASKNQQKQFSETLREAGFCTIPSFRFGSGGFRITAYFSPARFLAIIEDAAANTWKVYTPGLPDLMRLLVHELEPFAAIVSRSEPLNQEDHPSSDYRLGQRLVPFPQPRSG